MDNKEEFNNAGSPMTEELIADFRDAFKTFDTDEDGYLTLKELGDLTESEFNKVKPYIKNKLNSELVNANAVNTVKDIVDSANLKNYLISLLTRNIINQYLLYDNILFSDSFDEKLEQFKTEYTEAFDRILKDYK